VTTQEKFDRAVEAAYRKDIDKFPSGERSQWIYEAGAKHFGPGFVALVESQAALKKYYDKQKYATPVGCDWEKLLKQCFSSLALAAKAMEVSGD